MPETAPEPILQTAEPQSPASEPLNPSTNPQQPPQKKLRGAYKVKDSHIIYKALLEQGIPDYKAAELAGFKRGSATGLKRRMEAVDISKTRYTKPALKALKSFLEGKNFGEIKELKDSTVMSAINAVIDRAQPIVHQSQSVNLNVTIDPVDVSDFLVKREEETSAT